MQLPFSEAAGPRTLEARRNAFSEKVLRVAQLPSQVAPVPLSPGPTGPLPSDARRRDELNGVRCIGRPNGRATSRPGPQGQPARAGRTVDSRARACQWGEAVGQGRAVRGPPVSARSLPASESQAARGPVLRSESESIRAANLNSVRVRLTPTVIPTSCKAQHSFKTIPSRRPHSEPAGPAQPSGYAQQPPARPVHRPPAGCSQSASARTQTPRTLREPIQSDAGRPAGRLQHVRPGRLSLTVLRRRRRHRCRELGCSGLGARIPAHTHTHTHTTTNTPHTHHIHTSPLTPHPAHTPLQTRRFSSVARLQAPHPHPPPLRPPHSPPPPLTTLLGLRGWIGAIVESSPASPPSAGRR